MWLGYGKFQVIFCYGNFQMILVTKVMSCDDVMGCVMKMVLWGWSVRPQMVSLLPVLVLM